MGHQALFDYPRLPASFASCAALLGQMRTLRNTEGYEAVNIVTPQQAADAISFADEMIADVATALK